jgi:hypothetical protein
VCDHDQISVRILHEDFALARLSIADLTPDIAWAGIERPADRSERVLDRFDAGDIDLEHDPAAVEDIRYFV